MRDNKQDRARFAKVITGCAEEFGGTVSVENMAMKFNAMKDIDIEDIETAAVYIVQNREKTYPPIPTVKEFRDALKVIKGDNIPLKALAEAQCDFVLHLLKFYGKNCKHEFEDSVTKYLMSTRWSFDVLGGKSEKDLVWFRKSFVEDWIEMKKTAPEPIKIECKPGPIPVENLQKLIGKD